MASMAPTFLASLRAVGTASTMAFVGFYMHQRGFVTSSGKKTLALLAQQVTIPAFLFAKIIHCPDNDGDGNGNNDSTVCPSVADRLSDLKLLLVWPAYVVLCGLVTGYFAARVSKTPQIQTNSCLAACAFGNSTGLVITLLTVVHKQFKGSGSELGRIDPTSFLSVYLLLYPVLQWGVGGWLLAPEEKKEVKNPIKSIDMNTNAKLSFARFDHFDQNDSFNSEEDTLQTASTSSSTSPTTYQQQDDDTIMMEGGGPSSISLSSLRNVSPPTINEHTPLMTSTLSQELQELDVMPLTTTLLRISRKVCQPPVIASIAGLLIASFPNVRGLLVNIWGSIGETAPFDWMFDGIYSVGQAAVPINMTILGINLSSTFKKKSKEEDEKEKAKLLPNRTMLAIVVRKMVVMPVLGILSTWFLQRYYIDFPDEIAATCYLVIMIVFITPTANNVMVMVELSGSSSKEGMARMIGYMFLISPVVLSIVLTLVVRLASCHFDCAI